MNQTREVVIHCAKYISGKTLDLGAGTAKYRGLIKPRASEYVTLDFVAGPNVDVVSSVLHTPFADSSFDTIVSTQVLEHVDDPEQMVREIARLLKPGGYVLVSAPFLVPYHADPNDYFRYTQEGLSTFCVRAGLGVIEGGRYGGFFTVLSEFVHFVFLNPYKHHSRLANFAVKVLQAILLPLDSLTHPKIIFANVYVVARKP
ncbi:MAG TPA: class I SAM-dependent methyltransferase [Candidatus Paceibacterota bacterium]